MRLLLVTAACAVALALPAFADQTAAAAPSTGDTPAIAPTGAPAATPPKADEGVICKMKEVTGTRFSKKVCTTKAQRDEQAAQGRDLLGSTHPELNKAPGS